jgi:hypothetical protein
MSGIVVVMAFEWDSSEILERCEETPMKCRTENVKKTVEEE